MFPNRYLMLLIKNIQAGTIVKVGPTRKWVSCRYALGNTIAPYFGQGALSARKRLVPLPANAHQTLTSC